MEEKAKLAICGYTVQIDTLLPPGTLLVSSDVAKGLAQAVLERAMLNQVEISSK